MTDQELIRALREIAFDIRIEYADHWTEKTLTEAADRLTAVLGELEQVTRERDAAVEDLRVASIEGDMDCNWCAWKTDRTQCYNCSFANNWQWSGPKEAET